MPLFFDHDLVPQMAPLKPSDWANHDLVFKIDAVEMLKKLPDGSIDLCIFDPAYESLEKHRARGTTTRLKKSKSSSNKWFDVFPNERYPELLTELYRVMKPGTHIYIFCDETTADVLKPIAREVGFWVWKSLIWVKTTKRANSLWDMLRRALKSIFHPTRLTRHSLLRMNVVRDLVQALDVGELMSGMTRTGLGWHWRNSCERILFLEKRSTKQNWPRLHPTGRGRKLNSNSLRDILYAAPVLDDDAYPTQKPVSVIEQLIANSSEEGETVLDVFGGSGATGEAASNLYRRFILCDTSDDSIDTMRQRF